MEIMEQEKTVAFGELPRIGHRCDALDLLKSVIEAEEVKGMKFVLLALQDAIQREVI